MRKSYEFSGVSGRLLRKYYEFPDISERLLRNAFSGVSGRLLRKYLLSQTPWETVPFVFER